ncbi:MAG: hypothetical protein JNK72_16090 [Myxococcales bacterium]|nr:hypothetical protein [Myxococcales bacterium]
MQLGPYRTATLRAPPAAKAWSPWVSLLALACAATVAWRVELYHHGWPGLAWTAYFHRAIALGVAGYLVWLGVALRARVGVMLAVVVGLGLLAAPLYAVMRGGLVMAFGRFPLGLHPWVLGCWFLPWATVLCAARLAGLRPHTARVVGSWLLWAGALPLGTAWLMLTAPAFADAVHAVKTGAAIPFLIVSLGLPFAGGRAQ